MKKCRICQIEKEFIFFNIRKDSSDGYRNECKSCKIKISKKTKIAYDKKYYQLNKKKKNKYKADWMLNNPEKAKIIRKRETKQLKFRYQNDYLFRLKCIIRSSIKNCFKRKDITKITKTELILGCTFLEFKKYIESKFEPWMNWENHGKYNGELNYGWDIDHIIPIAVVNCEEDLIRINHYTNLQPLCSYTNRDIKRDKTI